MPGACGGGARPECGTGGATSGRPLRVHACSRPSCEPAHRTNFTVARRGFRAGQFVRVGVEIDGVRRTRTYSPASSALSRNGCLELTATVHPQGLVSTHLKHQACPGTIVHLGPAQGEFVLPEPRPDRVVLISGGSGHPPGQSILRTP